MIALMCGANLVVSFTQLDKVDKGAITRNGPEIHLISYFFFPEFNLNEYVKQPSRWSDKFDPNFHTKYTLILELSKYVPPMVPSKDPITG